MRPTDDCDEGGTRRRERFFNRREGNHLAGDFGEPFGPPKNGDIALFVHGDDVAGVVPFVGFDEYAGSVGEVVAEHAVGPAEKETAAAGAWHGFEAVLDAGKEAADRTCFVAERGVHGQCGRGLGGAVAFEDANAEPFVPDFLRGGLEFLGSGEDVAQRVEIVVVGFAGVAVKKRIGCKKDRGVGAVDKFRDHSVVERSGVEHGAHT